MSFQWLDMRISEEKDRRRREAEALERLPRALEDLHGALAECIGSYQAAFGLEAADIYKQASKIRILSRQEVEGRWQQVARVEVAAVPKLPGFQIDLGTGGDPVLIEVGILPGDKLFYRDRAKDQYVSMEDVTRCVLDRAFFPKLGE